LPLFWQVLATCWTPVTFIDCCEVPALAVPPEALLLLADDDELLGEPVIFTSWPTCSANFDVSPASCIVFPLLSVKV